MYKKALLVFIVVVGAALAGAVVFKQAPVQFDLSTETGAAAPAPPAEFDGGRAYADVLYQTGLGPRTIGSPAHAQAVDWMAESLQAAGWDTEVQEAQIRGQTVRNVVGRWRPGGPNLGQAGAGEPWIILGAHYDSRFFADMDPDPENRSQPVPGANDGASGVAVLLEIARTLPGKVAAWQDGAGGESGPGGEVWIVFFDAEDNGNIAGWNWILGSRAFAQALEGQPDAVVIVDMVGDADLNLYLERSSSPELAQSIWDQAAQLGYRDYFIPEYKYNILDDHRPFLERGIPAVDIIDFDYPYWHTIADTADKVTSQSLKVVGDTVLSWVVERLKN